MKVYLALFFLVCSASASADRAYNRCVNDLNAKFELSQQSKGMKTFDKQEALKTFESAIIDYDENAFVCTSATGSSWPLKPELSYTVGFSSQETKRDFDKDIKNLSELQDNTYGQSNY